MRSRSHRRGCDARQEFARDAFERRERARAVAREMVSRDGTPEQGEREREAVDPARDVDRAPEFGKIVPARIARDAERRDARAVRRQTLDDDARFHVDRIDRVTTTEGDLLRRRLDDTIALDGAHAAVRTCDRAHDVLGERRIAGHDRAVGRAGDLAVDERVADGETRREYAAEPEYDDARARDRAFGEDPLDGAFGAMRTDAGRRERDARGRALARASDRAFFGARRNDDDVQQDAYPMFAVGSVTADDGGHRAQYVSGPHRILGGRRLETAMDHAVGALRIAALATVLRPIRIVE